MTRFVLNDALVETELPSGLPVLDFVREARGLVGTKHACREGDCGACLVLLGELAEGRVHYRAVCSCLLPLAAVAGRHVVTVEGINQAALTPVQRAMVDEGAFLEHARVFDHSYGTAAEVVRGLTEAGHDVLLEIDWQGARQVRSAMPGCLSIFILPPSLAELERRLRGRGTDADDVIRRRLRDARDDMSHWREFDFVVVNDDFDEALGSLRAILRGDGADAATDSAAARARVAMVTA